MAQAIETSALTKRFGTVQAVTGVSFAVSVGEVVGFLGPNGAGKTTTMRMIAGYLDPSAGTARICGVDVAENPVGAKRHLGYLPEGAPLYGDMSVRDFLGFIAAARGIPKSVQRERIASIAARVRLEDVMDRRIDTLSKGFKRRVGIAQAVIHDPEVLVLDEPTDGLDPNQKHEMRSFITDLGRSGKAILISTHLLEEVETTCSRVLLINAGTVKMDGTPADLRAVSPGGTLDDAFRTLTVPG